MDRLASEQCHQVRQYLHDHQMQLLDHYHFQWMLLNQIGHRRIQLVDFEYYFHQIFSLGRWQQRIRFFQQYLFELDFLVIYLHY